MGLAIGWALARALRLPADTRSALLFGLSTKHTGLALVLAGSVLAEQPLAILLIVLATLIQHLLAGVVQWILLHTFNAPETTSSLTPAPALAPAIGCRALDRPIDDRSPVESLRGTAFRL